MRTAIALLTMLSLGTGLWLHKASQAVVLDEASSKQAEGEVAPLRDAYDDALVYDLFLDANFLLSVSLCGENLPPRLSTQARAISPFVVSAQRQFPDERTVDLRLFGRQLPIPGAKEGGCLRYQLDLKRASEVFDDVDMAKAINGALVASPDLWLWYPADFKAGQHLIVREAKDSFASFLGPWPQDERGDYWVPKNTFERLNRAVFGTFSVADVQVPGAHLRVAKLSSEQDLSLEQTREWIQGAGEAIAGIYGAFPRQSALLIVHEAAIGRDAVPWAQVVRGGGPTIELYARPGVSKQQLLAGWVTTHELSHLFLPYVQRRDAWFSEGLATYYQNVSRARAGLISEEQGWLSLHRGFRKAWRQVDGRSLKETSSEMYQTLAFKRVYWTGAAYFLLVDQALRTRTHNAMSLDEALAAIRNLAERDDKTWTAQELIVQLDRAVDGKEFSEGYSRYVLSRRFPPTSKALSELGIEISGREVRFRDDAKHRSVGRSIMALAHKE